VSGIRLTYIYEGKLIKQGPDLAQVTLIHVWLAYELQVTELSFELPGIQSKKGNTFMRFVLCMKRTIFPITLPPEGKLCPCSSLQCGDKMVNPQLNKNYTNYFI
jgi:hypothetical protein